MLKCQHRTADQRLTELITKVRGTVGGFCQNLLWCLVQPLAHRQDILPVSLNSKFFILKFRVIQTRIGRHIHSRTSNRPRAYTTAHTVADLTARTSGSAVEGLHRGGEVVGLGFQRDDALDILHLEIVARALVLRRELLNNRTLCKSHVILIGRKNLVLVLLRGLLDHGEERALHLLAVDNKRTTEDLMTAVLGVDLGKSEDLRICQRTTVLLLQTMQVFYLLGRKSEALLLVVFLQIVHVLDGLRLDVDRKDVLVKTIVHALQHLVVFSILVRNGKIFLNTADALEAHVLGNFHGVCRPGGHHFTTGTNIIALQLLCIQQLSLAIQPVQLLNFLFTQCVINLRGNHRFLWRLKEAYHTLLIIYFEFVCKGTNK